MLKEGPLVSREDALIWRQGLNRNNQDKSVRAHPNPMLRKRRNLHRTLLRGKVLRRCWGTTVIYKEGGQRSPVTGTLLQRASFTASKGANYPHPDIRCNKRVSFSLNLPQCGLLCLCRPSTQAVLQGKEEDRVSTGRE